MKLTNPQTSRLGTGGSPPQPPLSQAGFSLAELVVGIALTVLVLLIALLMFDVNARVSRVQTSVTDMQQAQRVGQNELVRLTRMAGRGGLPITWAIGVNDNVDLDEDEDPIVIGDNEVVDGSDVLTVRGVFSTPIYQLDSRDEASYTYGEVDDDVGELTISSLSPTGVFQPLTSISEAAEGEALIVVSPVDDGIYAVVEMVDVEFDASDVDGDGTEEDGEGTAVVTFSGDPGASENNTAFLDMGTAPGVFPPQLTEAVAFVGILEEHRFYIRDDASAAGGFTPSLSRGRFYPNTDVVHPDGTDGDDIADNIVDLQVARAYDLDNDNTIDENADKSADEWLLNHADDDPEDEDWVGRDLLNVRVSTIARTDRPDRGYLSPPLEDLENRDYGESPYPADTEQMVERSSRRRRFVTVIDLRNFT